MRNCGNNLIFISVGKNNSYPGEEKNINDQSLSLENRFEMKNGVLLMIVYKTIFSWPGEKKHKWSFHEP